MSGGPPGTAPPPGPSSLAEIDWRSWQPVDRATLLFVVRHGRVLLIRKKRGLGAGKINGPGGRIDPGETPLQAAVREVHEEVGVTPVGVVHAGTLCFQFRDGYAIHVEVFRADDCHGRPRETDEAVPLWVPLEEIPYDKMWADDRLWLPRLLARRPFFGRFLFSDDEMLDYELGDAAP